MAVVAIKFRCFRCNQLLGVSRSKAGTIVSCPKCSAELIVPEPDFEESPATAESEPAAEEPRPTWPLPASSGPSAEAPSRPLDTGISLDYLDIRPEDIRVEPGVRPVSRPAPPAPTRPATVVEPVQVLPNTWSEPEEGVPHPEPRDRPAPQRTNTVASARPAPEPAPDVILPAIEIDSTERPPKKSYIPPPRPRDLVLPRSVVASWSLFVLLALALAFFAGLLAGHFVWKVH